MEGERVRRWETEWQNCNDRDLILQIAEKPNNCVHDHFSAYLSWAPKLRIRHLCIDTEHLKLLLNGALNLTDIVHLEIKEQRGDRIIDTSVGNLTAENLIRRDFTLSYSDASGATRNIGSLTVTVSLDGVYQRLFSRVFTVLVTNTIKTFLASAGILATIFRMASCGRISLRLY